jgi:hypothetical protein
MSENSSLTALQNAYEKTDAAYVAGIHECFQGHANLYPIADDLHEIIVLKNRLHQLEAGVVSEEDRTNTQKEILPELIALQNAIIPELRKLLPTQEA